MHHTLRVPLLLLLGALPACLWGWEGTPRPDLDADTQDLDFGIDTGSADSDLVLDTGHSWDDDTGWILDTGEDTDPGVAYDPQADPDGDGVPGVDEDGDGWSDWFPGAPDECDRTASASDLTNPSFEYVAAYKLWRLPCGTFLYDGPESPSPRAITLTYDLWVGAREVQFGDLGFNLINTTLLDDPPWAEQADLPVGTGWNGAARIANAASAELGLELCYSCLGAAGGHACTPRIDPITDCEGYRLPTHAEWRYLARSGGRMPEAFPSGGLLPPDALPILASSPACQSGVPLDGDGPDYLVEQAYHRCSEDSPATSPQATGQLLPSPLGLYDVVGNLAEWLNDTPDHDPSYDGVGPSVLPDIDPSGFSTSLDTRVAAGGDYDTLPGALRIQAAFQTLPATDVTAPVRGVRLVRTASNDDDE